MPLGEHQAGQGSSGGNSPLPSWDLATHPLPSGRNGAAPLPVPYWADWTGTAAGARGLLGAGPRSPKAPQSITAPCAPSWRGNKALAQLLEPPGTGNKSVRRGLQG